MVRTVCFTTFPEYTAVTQLPRTTLIRNPWAQQTALAMEKKFALREGTKLQFKAEAFNATNTPILAVPIQAHQSKRPHAIPALLIPTSQVRGQVMERLDRHSRTFHANCNYQLRCCSRAVLQLLWFYEDRAMWFPWEKNHASSIASHYTYCKTALTNPS